MLAWHSNILCDVVISRILNTAFKYLIIALVSSSLLLVLDFAHPHWRRDVIHREWQRGPSVIHNDRHSSLRTAM